jgi:hypothetical protein
MKFPYSTRPPCHTETCGGLERASIITRNGRGRWRSARLAPTSLARATSWLSLQERLWAERFDRLDGHLARLASEPATTLTETGDGNQER